MTIPVVLQKFIVKYGYVVFALNMCIITTDGNSLYAAVEYLFCYGCRYKGLYTAILFVKVDIGSYHDLIYTWHFSDKFSEWSGFLSRNIPSGVS